MVGLLLLGAVISAAIVAPTTGASATSRPVLTAYAGVGTWLDIYAKKAWRHPQAEVAAMARDGAQTLFLQTGNYNQRADLVRPRALGRFVDAAHAAGLAVVAWYLPSFARPRQDLRRAMAAIRFRSGDGERFDSFALDIEATQVRRLRLRDRRLLRLSARLRSEGGPGYPLGAITPSPIGMAPSYWPGIPYHALTRTYNVFLPMAYSTMRGVRGSNATLAYLSATVTAIRRDSGNPLVAIHLIGGLGGAMDASDTAGFMRAVADCAPFGYSFYAFPTTRPTAWAALTTPLPGPAAGDPPCS